MIADHESHHAHPEHSETLHEPTWQTLVGCLIVVLSLALLWVMF